MLIDIIARAKVVPVVALDNPEHVVSLAQALRAGGIDVIELTLRTPNAMEVIKTLIEAKTGITIGVGTVITTEQVEICAKIGADFIVTPGTTPRLADAIEANKIAACPGISTTGEAVAMLERGYDFVKFFPAEANGGIKALKAIGGPLPQLKFMPTGGISKDMVASYLALPSVVGVGGSWVCSKDDLANQKWANITTNAQLAQAI